MLPARILLGQEFVHVGMVSKGMESVAEVFNKKDEIFLSKRYKKILRLNICLM